VSKPCTPVVHIKIAGKWMFIPLKMVLIGIDPYPHRYCEILPVARSREEELVAQWARRETPARMGSWLGFLLDQNGHFNGKIIGKSWEMLGTYGKKNL